MIRFAVFCVVAGGLVLSGQAFSMDSYSDAQLKKLVLQGLRDPESSLFGAGFRTGAAHDSIRIENEVASKRVLLIQKLTQAGDAVSSSRPAVHYFAFTTQVKGAQGEVTLSCDAKILDPSARGKGSLRTESCAVLNSAGQEVSDPALPDARKAPWVRTLFYMEDLEKQSVHSSPRSNTGVRKDLGGSDSGTAPKKESTIGTGR